MSVVTAHDLTVRFGTTVALDGVSFSLPDGCLAALVGPNGAGKSTLFRAALGLLHPDRGRIDITGTAAYVPQGDHVRRDLPLSARDVVLMGRFDHTPWWRPLRRGDRIAADRALDTIGMGGHATCQVGTLSGGQRQRVMIARALAQEATVLLLDEPLTGVDTSSEHEIVAVIQQLREAGATIIMSTHDLNQAARIADRMLLLNRTLVADGPPGEVFTPETLRRAYVTDLFVVDPATGAPLGVFDDASHHQHGHDHGPHGDHPAHH
jgi:ABC-type Mn2+/Zn2+ transport system ATPase subunit